MTENNIQLYFWATPNGYKPLILLEELKLSYDLFWIDIGAGDQFKPEFLDIAPNNRIPALVEQNGPDEKPIALFESGAILLYLARKMGKFYGTNLRQQIEIEKWLFWQMGGLGPMLGQVHHFTDYAPETIPYALERYRREAARLYGVLNKQLEDKPFIAGDYSIADIACFPWIRPHKNHGLDIADYPHVATWFETISERPAVKRALEIGNDKEARAVFMNDPEARKIMFGV